MKKTIPSIILALVITLAGVAAGAGPSPIPELSSLVRHDVPGKLVWTMKAPLGTTGEHVGLTITCSTTGPAELTATAFLGPLPPDRRPLQLAVHTPVNTIERFGPGVTAGPESGTYSPTFTDRTSVWRLATAALVPGSLISNGYTSFRNAAPPLVNRKEWEALRACIRQYHPLSD